VSVAPAVCVARRMLCAMCRVSSVPCVVCRCRMSCVLSVRSHLFEPPFVLHSPPRMCIYRATIADAPADVLEIQFQGAHLDKKDFFGKSDPFLVISRVLESGTPVVVYRTEVIKKTLDPVWPKVKIPVQLLCNGDVHRPLIVECFDWNAVRLCLMAVLCVIACSSFSISSR
jgi:hypothetical protein